MHVQQRGHSAVRVMQLSAMYSTLHNALLWYRVQTRLSVLSIEHEEGAKEKPGKESTQGRLKTFPKKNSKKPAFLFMVSSIPAQNPSSSGSSQPPERNVVVDGPITRAECGSPGGLLWREKKSDRAASSRLGCDPAAAPCLTS